MRYESGFDAHRRSANCNRSICGRYADCVGLAVVLPSPIERSASQPRYVCRRCVCLDSIAYMSSSSNCVFCGWYRHTFGNQYYIGSWIRISCCGYSLASSLMWCSQRMLGRIIRYIFPQPPLRHRAVFGRYVYADEAAVGAAGGDAGCSHAGEWV